MTAEQKSENKQSDSYKKQAKKAQVRDITAADRDQTFTLFGYIEQVKQTNGPTIFTISDGTGLLSLKGFEAPGERAHPDIEEGDAVKTTVTIAEFQEELEGEIEEIAKLGEKGQQRLEQEITKVQKERAEVTTPSFLIEAPVLQKLQDRFTEAAFQIRLAIIQNRPIIVRHHNDADGYAAGYTLEQAIKPLIEDQHGGGKAAWEYYTRSPCSAPFYEIDDSIRDTAHSLSAAAKFSNKMPFVIIADNGSSSEDKLGIQQGKIHGMDFVVVDHHYFEEDVISEEVEVHINPYLVGEDGANFSAGMLCTELARFIYPDVNNITHIPAMAGRADRVDNPDVMEQYFGIAEQEGYTRELLDNMATVIDFVSAKIKFMEAREYIEVLFGEPREKQTQLVELMTPYIKQLEEQGLAMAQSAAQRETIGNTTVQTVSIDATFPGFGFYPKPGRAIGLLQDATVEEGYDPLITIGLLPSAITLRATDDANFSIHDAITHINNALPDAFVSGGGHANAGSINFVPRQQEAVLEALKGYIQSL